MSTADAIDLLTTLRSLAAIPSSFVVPLLAAAWMGRRVTEGVS
jgi:hypothetical protein